MAKTRPGIDRITKQELQAEQAHAARRLSGHLKQCVSCNYAGNNPYQHCGVWWELSKIAHRTARKLREYSRPETDHLTPMFTEQQCDPPPF